MERKEYCVNDLREDRSELSEKWHLGQKYLKKKEKQQKLEVRRKELLELKEKAIENFKQEFHRTNREHLKCDKIWRDYVALRNTNSGIISGFQREVASLVRAAENSYIKAEEERKQNNFSGMKFYLEESRSFLAQMKLIQKDIESIKDSTKKARTRAEEKAPAVSEEKLIAARKSLQMIKEEALKVDHELSALYNSFFRSKKWNATASGVLKVETENVVLACEFGRNFIEKSSEDEFLELPLVMG